jgi:hypothetical protein
MRPVALHDHFRLALEAHMHAFDASGHIESLSAHMESAARAGRAEEDLTGPLARERDELLDRLDAE